MRDASGHSANVSKDDPWREGASPLRTPGALVRAAAPSNATSPLGRTVLSSIIGCTGSFSAATDPNQRRRCGGVLCWVVCTGTRRLSAALMVMFSGRCCLLACSRLGMRGAVRPWLGSGRNQGRAHRCFWPGADDTLSPGCGEGLTCRTALRVESH